MGDDIMVNIESLKKLAKDLESKRKIVNDLYEEKIKMLVTNNANALDIQGITMEKEQENIAKIAKDFDKNISDLIDLLNKKIIPNYEDIKEGIAQLFNENLLGEMESLLNDGSDE